jgi:hypothetical protein
MVRCVLRLALWVALLCSGALVVIRAQPYHDRELRRLLLPDACAAPCFLGIRPGVTPLSDALDLLRASQWVQTETIAYSEADYGGGAVWSWNRQAAPLLGKRVSSLITRRSNGVQVVELLHINTTIAIGDIYLALGPTPYTGTGDTGMPNEGYVALFYRDQGLSIWSNVPCPTLNHTLWIEPVSVQFRHDLNRFNHFNAIGSFC